MPAAAQSIYPDRPTGDRSDGGAGTTLTAPFRLPHGRYTVYAFYDPEDAVRSFNFVDDEGHALPDWNSGSIPVSFVAPLVQQVLPAGSYHLELETATGTCSWMVQVVLNSMLSWEAPPHACRSPLPPSDRIELTRSQARTFRIAQTGFYDIRLTVGDWEIGAPWFGNALQPYSLNLRAADGHTIHIGHATGSTGRSTSGAFLGTGGWVVEMDTSSDWHLVITPVIGPHGGGTRAF